MTAWRFGSKRQDRSQHNHRAAQPDPFDQWIQVRMDHRKIGVRVCAGVDHVQIFAQRRGDRHHGAGLLIGRIEAARGIEHHH